MCTFLLTGVQGSGTLQVLSCPCKMDTLSFWSLYLYWLLSLYFYLSLLTLYWDLSLYLYLSLLTLLTGHLVQGSGTIPVCLVSTDDGLCLLRPQSGGYPLNLICLLVVRGDRQLLLGVPRSLDDGRQTVTVVGLVRSTPTPSILSCLLLFL